MCTDHKLGVFSEMARIWPNDKISPFLKNVKSYLHPKSKKSTQKLGNHTTRLTLLSETIDNLLRLQTKNIF